MLHIPGESLKTRITPQVPLMWLRTFTLEAWSQSVTYERKLLTPGEDQVTLRVRQPTHYILHIPSKQDLELCSQPAIKWTLRVIQRLEGLVRLLRVECDEHQVTVEQLHQPDLHLGDPHVSAGRFELLFA
jgi:hypothetical protein